MRYVLLAVSLYLAAVLQIGIAPRLVAPEFVPRCLPALALVWLLAGPRARQPWAVLLILLAEDLQLAGRVGPGVLAGIALAALVGSDPVNRLSVSLAGRTALSMGGAWWLVAWPAVVGRLTESGTGTWNDVLRSQFGPGLATGLLALAGILLCDSLGGRRSSRRVPRFASN